MSGSISSKIRSGISIDTANKVKLGEAFAVDDDTDGRDLGYDVLINQLHQSGFTDDTSAFTVDGVDTMEQPCRGECVVACRSVKWGGRVINWMYLMM